MAEQANYQGEHLGLSLNRDAAYALGDALERLRSSYRDDASAQVPLRLPVGRTLQLRVSLNDRGALHDSYGNDIADDGVAHGDVTGDLAAHADARQVLEAAVRPSLVWELTSGQRDGVDPVDVERLCPGPGGRGDRGAAVPRQPPRRVDRAAPRPRPGRGAPGPAPAAGGGPRVPPPGPERQGAARPSHLRSVAVARRRGRGRPEGGGGGPVVTVDRVVEVDGVASPSWNTTWTNSSAPPQACWLVDNDLGYWV